MTMTTSELPQVMTDAVQSQVIDVELLTTLVELKTINWCRAVRPMYPLHIPAHIGTSKLTYTA